LTLAALLAVPAAPVFGQGGNGQIAGIVRDEQGGVLPGATVTLKNEESGVTRSVVSEADGAYRFLALPPGRYSVKAVLAGFNTQEVKDSTITIGLELHQDFTLAIQSLAESVTVTGEAPVVDTTKSEISGVVTQRQIETLPINSRQYLSLALLMPGTSLDATRSFFPTVNVGASMTFNSTANIADGMINNWAEDGEPRQNFPEDAVQEFKVSNVQNRAEYGLTTSGVVQVVTKSGTNDFHGDVFEFFRDKSLNAKNVFETEKPDYRRHQFGGSLGGPIQANRMHFFGAFERTKVDQFYTVNTGLPQFYSSVEGTFPQPFYRNLYVGRVDWQITSSQSVFARYAHEDEKSTCGGCGGITATTAGYDQETPRRGLVLGHTWLRGAHQLNDFRFQYAHGGYFIAPGGTLIWKDTNQFPPARLNRLSQGLYFPSLTYGSSFDELGPESRWEFKDTYAISYSRHDVKFGGEFSYNPYGEENTGDILGTFTFSEDQFFDPNDPASVANLRGAATFSASLPPVHTDHPSKYYVAFVQDDWKIRPNLTLNIGLRYERLYGCCNEDLDPSIFPTPIPYIDVSKRGDKDNFGPRTGFAWDLFGDGHTVVRGGYGRYFGHTRILGTLDEFRNFIRYTVFISSPTYPDPYGGRDPSEFIASGPTNISVFDNSYSQPDAHQLNAGFSQQIGADFAVHVDGIYTDTNRDRKILDINAPDPVTGEQPDSTFGRVDRYQSTGEVRYRALYTRVEKRFSHGNQFLVAYTYTRSRDNNPIEQYIDPFNLGLDFGPSNGERRHSLVASGSVLLPWDIVVGTVWTLRSQLPWSATAGLDLNGDGLNTDLVPGTTRNAGSRTLDLAAVNAWRAANGLGAVTESQIDSSRVNIVDARVNKRIRFRGDLGIDLVLQVFNLFNTRNLQSQYGGGRVDNALSDTFGRILTARDGTQVELGVKLVW
jgi:hypothetical protein